MTLSSIGDLAQGFSLRMRQADLKADLTQLGTEISTGQVSDPVNRLGGHLSSLSQVEYDLTLAERFASSAHEVATSASAMQASITLVSDLSDKLVGTLTQVTNAAGQAGMAAAGAEARGALESMTSALNTSVAGRHLFSGTLTKTPPLASSDTILSELRTAISGATSPADIAASAEAFFRTSGGGFETLIYQGSSESLAPIRLGAGEAADLDLRADHAAFRDTLMYTALAALANDPTLSLNAADRRDLLDRSLNGLLTTKDKQVALQADLGVTEARIERAATRIESEATTLRMTRNELLSVDPYETASRMEEVRSQLETIYAITARSARLNLVNFLS